MRVAVLTVSDTRTAADDSSGDYLATAVRAAGHTLVEQRIEPDDRYRLRAVVSAWIADEAVDCVISNGGTGITGRDVTPEALEPLFDKPIPGFGEVFRVLSLDDVGSSTVQSRATAGVANATLIFCLPGSTGACRLAWERVLVKQLDGEHRPCNFQQLLPRLRER